MQEVIIKARYDFKFFLLALIFAGMAGFFVWQYFSVKDQPVVHLFAAAFILAMLALLLLRLIKQIRLGEQSFTVETFLLPPKSISYDEVTRITPNSILMKRGGYSIATVKNAPEIYELMKQRMEGRMSGPSLDDAPNRRTEIIVKSIRPAAIISAVLIIATILIWPTAETSLLYLRSVAIFIAIVWLMYRFIESREP